MRLSKKKRKELKALAEKATPGPWGTDCDPRSGMEGNVFVNCAPGVTVAFPAIDPDDDEWSQSNMDFIAASREALPAALADIDELEVEREQLLCDKEGLHDSWISGTHKIEALEAKLADAVKALEGLRRASEKGD